MQKRIFLAVLVSIVVTVLFSTAWGRTSDDLMFDWLEVKYHDFIAPAGSQSVTMGNYYFRHYPETDSYVGIDRDSNDLYYMGPLWEGLWNLGSASGWQAQMGIELDSCLFDWFEENYPEHVSPAGSQSVTMANYYFRQYLGTGSFLGTDRNNGRLYYMGPRWDGQMLDLGMASEWQKQVGCLQLGGSEQEVRNLLDLVMGLTTTTLSDGLIDQVEPLLAGLLMGSTPSSCPVVETNLDTQSLILDIQHMFDSAGSLDDIPAILDKLPRTINVSASYGSGCQTEDGDTFSGSMALEIQDWQVAPDFSNIRLSLRINADNLKQNGMVVGNGSMSGNFNVDIKNENLTADIQLQDFLVGDEVVMNGIMTMAADGIENIRISLIGVDSSTANVFNTRLNMTVTEVGYSAYQINTSSGSVVNGYEVEFANLIFDDELCLQYPVGGEIIFRKGGKSWTATFDDSCSGAYDLR